MEAGARAASPKVTTRQFLELFSAVMLPMFLAVADQTLLATATPRIAAELGGLRDTTWIALGYMIAVTITVPLYGRLGDRRGRRDMLMVALAVFSAGSVGCGTARSLGWLVVARIVQGLGGGGLMVLSQALIGEIVPGRERARFQAWFAMNFTIASISGPLIGGLVVQHGDWRWLFLANIPLAALAAWRITRLPAGDRNPGAALEDIGGIALFAAAACALLVWLTFGGHRFDWLSLPSLVLGGTGLALAGLLAVRERRLDEPFLPVELLRQRDIALMAATVALFAACLFAIVFFLPIYLQLGYGARAAAAGLLLLPVTIGMVFGATVTGRYISRTGRAGRLPPRGLLLAAVAIGALAFVPAQPWAVAPLCLLCGLGFGTVMPTSQVVIQSLAGRERLGASSSLVSLARSVGGALGTALFGAIAFGLMHGGGSTTPSSIPGDGEAARQLAFALRAMFCAVAATALLASACAARMRRIQL